MPTCNLHPYINPRLLQPYTLHTYPTPTILHNYPTKAPRYTYLPYPHIPTRCSYEPYTLPYIPALPLQASLVHTYHTYATSMFKLLCGAVEFGQ